MSWPIVFSFFERNGTMTSSIWRLSHCCFRRGSTRKWPRGVTSAQEFPWQRRQYGFVWLGIPVGWCCFLSLKMIKIEISWYWYFDMFCCFMFGRSYLFSLFLLRCCSLAVAVFGWWLTWLRKKYHFWLDNLNMIAVSLFLIKQVSSFL